MLDLQTIAALAAELHDAERRRVQVRHFSLRHPQMATSSSPARSRGRRVRSAVTPSTSTTVGAVRSRSASPELSRT